MAASRHECSICMDSFKNPKLISCHHSFCYKCLEDYVQVNLHNGRFNCPICRTSVNLPKSGISGFQSNFYIDTDSSEKFPCEICGPKNMASSRCLDCEENLCQSCCYVHEKSKALRHHKIRDLGTLDSEMKGKIRQRVFCDQHPEEEIKLVCQDCKVPICLMCKAIKHDTHPTKAVADAAAEVKKSLDTKLNQCSDKLRRIKASSAKGEELDRSINDAEREELKAVDDHCSQLHKAIDQEAAKFKDKIKNVYHLLRQQNAVFMTYMQEEFSSCSNTKDNAQKLRDQGTDIEIVKKGFDIEQLISAAILKSDPTPNIRMDNKLFSPAQIIASVLIPLIGIMQDSTDAEERKKKEMEEREKKEREEREKKEREEREKKERMAYLDRMCDLKRAVVKYNQTILASQTPITVLRPRQIDALYNLRVSKDLVVVLPTGYGKTLIFELLPFYLQCKVVVLEPLNAILNQLCSTLDGHVIRVTEHFQDHSTLCMGEFSYIVGHPEDILDKNVLECLLEAEWTKQQVCLIIDEAHCILQWQDEFRPAYKEIKNLRALFPVCTICAMTATINKGSIKSIKKELKLSRCSIINCTPLLRKNISLLVRRRPPYSSDTTPTSPYDCVFKSLFEDLIRTKENGSCFPVTIVYTRLVWCGKAIEQAKLLLGDQLYNGEKKEENCIVVQYHSPQSSKVNEYILCCLSRENNHIKIIFATIALGMGADLRKVHRVIHAGSPSSVEEYLQEVGRAGRDGLKAEAIIFYNNNDLSSKLIEKDMKGYLTLETGCRRKFLNNYFDCPYEAAEFICCDLCQNDALGSAFGMKQIAGQNQIDRYLVHMALKEYVRADISGEIAFHLHDDLLQRITETFDMIPIDINEIVQYYNIPRYIAVSLNAILVTFRK